MQKLKSANRFKEFLSSERRGAVAALILIAGVALLFLGGSLGKGDNGSETLEERTAQLCSAIDGVGECRVMITYSEDESVYAVAVLCEGADTLTVRRDVTELTSSLFGIGANRVSVLKISK